MTRNPSLAHLSGSTARPREVTVPLGLVGLIIVSNIAGPLLPSSEGDIAFGVVEAVIAAVAAWGLWRQRRWGRIMTIVVAALNLLSDAPAIMAGSTVAIKLAGGVAVLACLGVIVLLTRPEARRLYGSRR